MMEAQLITLVALLQAAQTVSKILHWRTRSFSQHMALDELNEALVKCTDTIAETALGLCPGCLDNLQSCTSDLSETDAITFIRQLSECLEPLCDAVGELSDALETTLDDLRQAVYTAKYKLEQLS